MRSMKVDNYTVAILPAPTKELARKFPRAKVTDALAPEVDKPVCGGGSQACYVTIRDGQWIVGFVLPSVAS